MTHLARKEAKSAVAVVDPGFSAGKGGHHHKGAIHPAQMTRRLWSAGSAGRHAEHGRTRTLRRKQVSSRQRGAGCSNSGQCASRHSGAGLSGRVHRVIHGLCGQLERTSAGGMKDQVARLTRSRAGAERLTANGHDSRDTPNDESHDRPPLPPALLPQGEKQPCLTSSVFWLPGGVVFNHSIHDRKQFAHTGDDDHLGRFPGPFETICESFDRRIAANRGNRCHV